MPHQPSNGQVKIKFVSVSLTVELKADLHQWADDTSYEDLVAYMNDAYLDGYRLGVKGEEVGVSASLTSLEKGQSKANSGTMLVERATTVERALKRLFWAHVHVFEKTWPKSSQVIDDDW